MLYFLVLLWLVNKYLKLTILVSVCELTGLAAAPFTASSVSTWYTTLNKPWFNPPNWIFAPVWTILYFLMGLAAYLVFQEGWTKPHVRRGLIYFAVQLVLNFAWSLVFFGLKQPTWAFVEILVLWTVILFTIITFYEISKTAAYLMLPYILWVSFALLLNFSIALLN